MFKYEVLGRITNQDFLGASRGLQDKCKSIEKKYRTNDLRGCCGEVREVIELIMKYLYRRLMHDNPSGEVGKILWNDEFKLRPESVRLNVSVH